MKTFLLRILRGSSRLSTLLAAACLAAFPVSLPAQDAEFVALIKTQNFYQDRPHLVSLMDEDDSDSEDAPLLLEAFVETSTPGTLNGATLDLPTPPGGTLTLTDPDIPSQQLELGFFAGFEVLAEMNEAFPDGTYTFNIDGANDSPPIQTISLDLSADASGTYRGIPKFTSSVVLAAQAIDPSLPFVFQWEAIPGGVATDFVMLSIEDDLENDIILSPDLGEPGALDGTSTSFTIPAGTLSRGTYYEVFLGVFHPVAIDTSYTTAVSAYGKTTTMEFRTTGGTDNDPPVLFRPVPNHFQADVGLNTIVTFHFSEPMDPTVDAAQAITWTGVPNPALFAYTWSPDRRTLFCNYPPGLPASATIGWNLNPHGALAQLRDAAGNNLSNLPATGSFQTSAAGTSGLSDVSSLLVYKARDFFQTSSGVTDLESYFAGFVLELNGISTVSSVDLGIPGVGAETGLGEFFSDNQLLEGEALFAEATDLDRIFPAGTYTLTVHTFHDGIQTVSLNLGAASYPGAPTVQNFTATQAIDGSQDFVLQWDAWAGGTANDFIEVWVESDFGPPLFRSAAIGQPGALDGTDTSVTIPAGTLPPGRDLEAEIIFAKVIDTNTTQYPGVPVASVFAATTVFDMQTAGSPLVPLLEILGHTGNKVTLRLTGEFGRLYEILSGDVLPPTNHVWTAQPFENVSGYRATFDYEDFSVIGFPTRFYQAREFQGSP